MFHSRRVKLFSIFFLVIAVGYGAVRLLGSSGAVPKDFTDARLQGALIAQNIVTLSNQATEDLVKISEFDRARDFDAALELTGGVILQSQEIRDQAVALSSEIEKMTRALPDIDSPEARQAALESITGRLALISRLINYSAYLSQLLDTLRAHFSGTSSSKKVAAIIEQINGEVRAINNFNNQAVQAMERFDKFVAQ